MIQKKQWDSRTKSEYAELWMYPRVSIKKDLDPRKYHSSHKVIKIITMEL
jgi:hypothetical protein